MNNPPHISILTEEMVSFFSSIPIKVFVDGTLGAGGHAERILQEHPEIEFFLGLDQDPEALSIAQQRLAPWKDKIHLVHTNFVHFDETLRGHKISAVDGFFFDLGVSSMQLDLDYKGFSFLQEGPLDMRMDPSNPLTAAEVIATRSEKELGRIFQEYGEEPRWKRAAHAIVEERRKRPITTTTQLSHLLVSTLKTKIRGRLHPATLVFQALRIYVNQEIESLETVLRKVLPWLSPQGIVGVISFHKFEDKIVKTLFQEAARSKKEPPCLSILTKKPLVPTLQEMRRNPRSRSAKLRFAQKIGGLA